MTALLLIALPVIVAVGILAAPLLVHDVRGGVRARIRRKFDADGPAHPASCSRTSG